MKYKAVAALAVLAAVAAALVVALPASAAGNAGTTQVSKFDPTGAVFTCPGTDYTVLGGSVVSVFHDSFAANGSEHVTGTIAPTGVTLTDGTTSTIYRLAGASWFGGNFSEATDSSFSPTPSSSTSSAQVVVWLHGLQVSSTCHRVAAISRSPSGPARRRRTSQVARRRGCR